MTQVTDQQIEKDSSQHLKMIRRRLWTLSWPAMISGLSVPFLGLVDTGIVGRVGSAEALGAVALASWLFDLLYWSFGFLRMGTTGIVSQARGRGDQAKLKVYLARPLLFGLVAGIFVLFTGQVFSSEILYLLAGDQKTLIGTANQYFTARIYGGPAVLMNYALLGYLLGIGKAKSALVMQVGLNGVNAIFSIWWGLSLGVEGVGYASAFAQWLILFYWLPRLWLKESPSLSNQYLSAGLKNIHEWKDLLSLNFDLWVRTCLLLGSFGLVNSVSARLGVLTLSANALLLHLQSLQAFALDGFAHGTEIMVGEFLGAKKLNHYQKTLRAGFEWSMGTALVIAVIYCLFADQLFELMTHHTEVIEESKRYLAWAICSPLISAPCFLLDGVMIGAMAGSSMRKSMIISAMGLVLLLQVLVPTYGNHGLWLAFLSFMLLRALTLFPQSLIMGRKGIS